LRHASQTDSVRPAPLCANRLGRGGMALGRSKKSRDASAALRPARRRRRPTQSSHRISHRATETRCSGGGLHANKSSYISVRWVRVCERQQDGLLLGQGFMLSSSAQDGPLSNRLTASMHRRAWCCVARTPWAIETGCKPCHAHRTTQQAPLTRLARAPKHPPPLTKSLESR
jgi:hypothetical protein